MGWLERISYSPESGSLPRGVAFTVGALGACAAFVVWRHLRKRGIPRYPQRIVVVSSAEEWALIASDFAEDVAQLKLVGLDCEWVMTSTKATHISGEANRTKSVHKRNKVALLQLAPSDRLCVLLRLSHMEMPREVADILESHEVIKVGVAVLDDAKKLFEDYGIQVRGCLDLRYMASSRQSDADRLIDDFSLAGLARRFVSIELDKSFKLRCANWESPQLSTAEVEYAAMDAYAGLAVALVLLGGDRFKLWSFSSSMINRCLRQFGIYVGIPFRRAAIKQLPKTADSRRRHESRIDLTKGRAAYTARKQQNVYKNSILQAPDGEVLCSTDELKLNWYLRMGLGEVVCENPFTVRLNFEPRCRAILGGEYYVDTRTNECVVCGAKEHLLKKNIVTQQYRKLFPAIMKSHTSHDMVLLCIQCQLSYTRAETALMAKLDEECPSHVRMPNFKAVKAAAAALLSAPDELTVERKANFEQIVREHLGLVGQTSPLTEEQLRSAASVNVRLWLRENNATHGLRVVQRYSSAEGPGLFELEILWRRNFLETMKPRCLSPKWSIVHNHDAVLMKIATGRDLSGFTVEQLLEVLGVSWDRMANLVDEIVREGLVSRERVLIWDLLDKHAHGGACVRSEHNGDQANDSQGSHSYQ